MGGFASLNIIKTIIHVKMRLPGITLMNLLHFFIIQICLGCEFIAEVSS